MIATILKLSSTLDAWLREHIGRPYLAALWIGLVLGIIGAFDELAKDFSRHDNVVKLSLFIAFQAALLVNQLAQFHDYREERMRRREAQQEAKTSRRRGRRDELGVEEASPPQVATQVERQG